MRWLRQGALWLALAAMALLAPSLPQYFPHTSEGMAAESYQKWAGVLRVWVATGWQPGGSSLTPWLNQSFARFERRHPGVYVQVQPVSAQILTQFAEGSINPPDMIVFGPGMLDSADHLLPLDQSQSGDLLGSLLGSGVQRGVCYAVPVAMGGYTWAINSKLISGAPTADTEPPAQPKRGNPIHLVHAPEDSASLSWSGALLSLLKYDPRRESGEQQRAPIGDGIDLGLTTPEPEAQPTPEPTPTEQAFFAPESLPENFRKQASVMSEFRAGAAAAIPVTQVEIARLTQLSDAGKAPDWAAVNGIESFTDQLAMCAIVDWPRDDAQQRQALCLSLIQTLLSEDAQQKLASVRALRVTRGTPLYMGGSAMYQLELGYLNRSFDCPNAFDTSFRLRAAQMLEIALTQ